MGKSTDEGIIYIMVTTVTGLIKIGQTGLDKYENRMKYLENNGYCNVTGLKRFFAISVDQYKEKEKLLYEIFSKSKVEDSELFALDKDLVKQLLLSFAGTVVYPKDTNKEKEFEEVTTKIRKRGENVNFFRLGIKEGEEITFKNDNSIIATVVSKCEVEYNGEIKKLTPLTRDIIYQTMGKLNPSAKYRGPAHWMYKGKILTKMMKDIYPKRIDKEEEIGKVATRQFAKKRSSKKRAPLFSFFERGIKIGDEISFRDDDFIIARVVTEREVEYNGQIWKLSPLTRQIYTDRNQGNSSGSYQGSAYWKFNGKILKGMPARYPKRIDKEEE
ncbi:MAG: hypothetical protein M1483_02325 [Actinobacteria bacterium]|jgi:hypothetical protein|nr:hypothetical protein [Actinomycetota bacterium]MCL6104464.1 hypothetical protein [Actinomycetota bacterium]